MEPGSSPQIRLAVLGPVRVWFGETRLDVGAARQQAMLLALALRPGVLVSRAQLLDGVWGAEPPGTGGRVVPVYLHRLRRALAPAGEVITSDRRGYRFAGTAVTDAAGLEEAVAAATAARRARDLDAAVERYGAALALFGGEPLAGLPGPFAAGERLRLAERRIAVLGGRAECLLRLGRYGEVVDQLSASTETHPHHEPLAVLLMRALYASGRPSDAVAAYARLRSRLVTDLGVEPGPDAQRIHRALRHDDRAALGLPARPDRAGGPSRGARRVELPADVAHLVGRERELRWLTTAAGARVVLVDGMPGAGKTALVVRAARLLRDRFPDGSLFVDLRGHGEGLPLDPRRALRRLLGVVGAGETPDDPGGPGDPDELVAAWRAATSSLRLLLVLDDATSAAQVRALQPAGDGSTMLVTSRYRLAGLDVDRRVHLGPLPLVEAGELLRALVGGARADREPEAVRELAARCGRLPLALRIAAARLQRRPMWTFSDLVDRMAGDGDRLDELTTEERGVPAAFERTYARLPAPARRAFRALGLSPTAELDRLTLAAMLGWSPRDAERVLEGLVDASLLQQPAAGRYRPHDLVAAYARRLTAGDADGVRTVQEGVFDLYVAAARRVGDRGPAGYPGGPAAPSAALLPDRAGALAWLDAAGGGLVGVVANAAAAGFGDHACRLAEGLVDYLVRQGRYQECRAALELVLPVADRTGGPMAAALRNALGTVDNLQGRYEQARGWLREALRLARRHGDLHNEALARCGLGVAASYLGLSVTAAAHLGALSELARRLDDDWLRGNAAYNLGRLDHQLGEPERALERFQEAVVLAGHSADQRMAVFALLSRSDVHADLGRYAQARAVLHGAVAQAGELGDRPVRAFGLTRLGSVEQRLGSVDAAIGLHRRALTEVTEQTSVELETETRVRLGNSYLAADRAAEAHRQFSLVLPLTRAGTPKGWQARAHRRALDGLRRSGVA